MIQDSNERHSAGKKERKKKRKGREKEKEAK